MQQQIPFHYGLFYGAMCHWLGREPDLKVNAGFDGFYDYVYYPNNKKEENHFEGLVQSIREWLDLFEIIFSGTHVEYSTSAGNERDKLALRITIRHEVPEPKKRDD